VRREQSVTRRWILAAVPLLLVVGKAGAQIASEPAPHLPRLTLSPADTLRLTGDVDSNSPVVWDRWDGRPEVFVLTSIAGRPSRAAGPQISQLGESESIEIYPWPPGGVWMEAVIPDAAGNWYGLYHNENTPDICGDTQKVYPRIGAALSQDQGATWIDLGIILDAPSDTFACDTGNAYFVGGVGDLSAVLDLDQNDVYIYFSQYARDARDQGVAVARLAWADRDDPVGKLTVWNHGVWLPPTPSEDVNGDLHWRYPPGSPIWVPSKPWHSGGVVDAFWGPSIHWNESLQQYVMLLNRTNDDAFHQEGIYVSFNSRLDEPPAWSTPTKILNGGSWYPQVVGLESARGTDKWAGKTARFFMLGRSDFVISFEPISDLTHGRRIP
jgi:hypothetical protein